MSQRPSFSSLKYEKELRGTLLTSTNSLSFLLMNSQIINVFYDYQKNSQYMDFYLISMHLSFILSPECHRK